MADWDAVTEAKRVLDKAINLENAIEKEGTSMKHAADKGVTCIGQANALSKDLLSHSQTLKEKQIQGHLYAREINQNLSQLHAYEIEEIIPKEISSIQRNSPLITVYRQRKKAPFFPNAQLPSFTTPGRNRLSGIRLPHEYQKGGFWNTISQDYKTLDEIEQEVSIRLELEENMMDKKRRIETVKSDKQMKKGKRSKNEEKES